MAGTNYDPSSTPEGGFSDVALVPSPTTPGKMTFAWNGDLVFDGTCAYAVLMTVVTKKGTYRPDRNQGTRVREVTSSGTATGSRLSSYAREAGPQLADVVSDLTANATPGRRGSWTLNLRWKAAGEQRSGSLEVSR